MSGWSAIRARIAGQRDTLIESLRKPDIQQRDVLSRIIERNKDSEFGRRFDFSSIASINDYQHRVPLHSYEDLRTEIDRMMAGEKSVLVADEVRLFESTGGSTGGRKFVPFTDASLAAVRSAVLPWLDDLVTSRRGIAKGKSYWSISPAIRQQAQTPGGIPIGVDNDAAYFGIDLAQSIACTMAVPASVASIQSFDKWRSETLCHLVACRNLSFVSVWSPTFFLQLLDAVRANLDLIASKVSAKRAGEVRDVFSASETHWQDLWPNLDTISCWCSSTSRRYAAEIANRFPETHIQGKGLLATEGIVTVPLEDAGAAVLAVDSAFYEFETADGDIVVAEDLETDENYSVLLTTEGGLYRYRLGDRVRVSGWYESTPCLEFVGREGIASDLCGEKLTEAFVETVLSDIPGFGFLVPITKPGPAYLMIVDKAVVEAGQEQSTARSADKKLMQNPQYRYARDIGQLPLIETCRISDPVGTYEKICVQTGQCLGDIKPTMLASTRWGEQFTKPAAS